VLLSNYRIYLSSISILKIVAVCRALLSKVKTLILRLVMWTNMFHCAKFHQKSSNSCREGDLTAFKIVTIRHFGFLKFKFLTAVRDPCCLQCFDAQLMPLPLTVSCTSKIQIGFTFLVLAYLSSPRKRAIKRVCVCVCVCVRACVRACVCVRDPCCIIVPNFIKLKKQLL